MKKPIAVAICVSAVIATAAVAIAQTVGTPLPAVNVCIGQDGSPVVTPRDGNCATGATPAALSQHADTVNLYEQLALFEGALSDTNKRLSEMTTQLDENAAGLANVRVDLDRAMDMFSIFIDLKYPVTIEFSDQVPPDPNTGEQGTCEATMVVRDALPGSDVRYRATPSDDYQVIGPVPRDGTFKTTVEGTQGQEAEIVVVSLAGSDVTQWADPCYFEL